MQPGYTACSRCLWPIQASEAHLRGARPSTAPRDPDAAADTASPATLDATDAAPLPDAIRCPRCEAELQFIVFPALFMEKAVSSTGERLVDDSQASCFYHTDRKAHIACDSCGRFLCELCDLPMGNRHLCPSCLESPSERSKEAQEVSSGSQAILFDNIALSLAVLPMPFVYPTLLTAPVVLFLVIRYWNRQTSMLPRSRWRFVVAGLLALLQLGGWVALVGAIAVSAGAF